MKELGHDQNPNSKYNAHPVDSGVSRRLRNGVVEFGYGFWHLKRTMREKRAASVDEAREFLGLAKENLVKNNQPSPYFSSDNEPKVTGQIGSGYYSSVFGFTSDTGDWAMKLSAPHSPMLANFHPSSPEFTEWYQYVLDIQRATYSEHLPFLIPEPQTVLHVQGSQNEKTVIIQPQIKRVLSKEEIRSLSSEDKTQLNSEFEIFQAVSKEVAAGFGLVPDFELATIIRSSSHFVISRQDGTETGTPHLVMLDNGLFDAKAPNRLFYEFNRQKGKRVIKGLKRKL
jgi:hypothetical protein